jgi:uncharacterized protein YeaO (DUF488 family)
MRGREAAVRGLRRLRLAVSLAQPRMMDVRTKRAHDPVEPVDGYRVLIDRLWPRGVKQDAAHLDAWARELAPNDELRRWFGHDPSKFAEFARRYREELAAHTDAVDELRAHAGRGMVTIVFGARDAEHSTAAVLAALLRERSGKNIDSPTTRKDAP